MIAGWAAALAKGCFQSGAYVCTFSLLLNGIVCFVIFIFKIVGLPVPYVFRWQIPHTLHRGI